jgi:hypothetical protein
LYVPKLDGTPELNADETQYFQQLIVILQWATELGKVDILHKMSILSQYQASPREGHMEQIMHTFSFLKKKSKLSIYMDPSLPIIEYGTFGRRKKTLPNITEEQRNRCLMICRGREGDQL